MRMVNRAHRKGAVMTTIIVKKRRTLTLNRTALPEKEVLPPITKEPEPVISGEARVAENNRRQKEERDRNYHECKAWIFSRWPELFDSKNVKPFELGIGKKIRAEYDSVGGYEVLGFGRTLHISRVLNAWTRRKAYLRALTKDGAQRFDLGGQPTGEVSEDHIASAKDKLEQKKQLDKKKKKGT